MLSRQWIERVVGWLGKVFLQDGPSRPASPEPGPMLRRWRCHVQRFFYRIYAGLRIEELFSIIRGRPARWEPLPSPLPSAWAGGQGHPGPAQRLHWAGEALCLPPRSALALGLCSAHLPLGVAVLKGAGPRGHRGHTRPPAGPLSAACGGVAAHPPGLRPAVCGHTTCAHTRTSPSPQTSQTRGLLWKTSSTAWRGPTRGRSCLCPSGPPWRRGCSTQVPRQAHPPLPSGPRPGTCTSPDRGVYLRVIVLLGVSHPDCRREHV